MKNIPRIGIPGGGQLARMLCLKAHELGLPCSILSESSDDPAAQVTDQWVQGNTTDFDTVLSFSKTVDFLTFESEFMPSEILEGLKQSSTTIYPAVDTMLAIQDRLLQKNLLSHHHIPTASFSDVPPIEEDIKKLQSEKLVLKSRRNGYDGKGTLLLEHASDSEIKQFVASYPEGFIAEELIPFSRELAVSFARTTSGHSVHFPLVETKQVDSRCLWVKGPLSHPQFDSLQRSLVMFLDAINYVGCITFELFDCNDKLLVNEIAPRVHNSAHYSLNGCTDDQFSMHLKAILGYSLSEPRLLCGGLAMYNLIGSTNEQAHWNLPPDIQLHWYGKKDNRPGRKMGHINAQADSPEEALRIAEYARKEFVL